MLGIKIFLALVLLGQVPREYKVDRYNREYVKEILKGKALPDNNMRAGMKIDDEVSNVPKFFEKLTITACIYRGIDSTGNIIVEIPDFIPEKTLKTRTPVVLSKNGKETGLSDLKSGDWIKVFVDDNGYVRGIIKSPIEKEVSK